MKSGKKINDLIYTPMHFHGYGKDHFRSSPKILSKSFYFFLRDGIVIVVNLYPIIYQNHCLSELGINMCQVSKLYCIREKKIKNELI
jgi:hypothetical protein